MRVAPGVSSSAKTPSSPQSQGEMPVTVNKIDTSVVAETLRQQIREDVAIVPGARPRLVGFLANKDPAARKYAEWTGRACTKAP